MVLRLLATATCLALLTALAGWGGDDEAAPSGTDETVASESASTPPSSPADAQPTKPAPKARGTVITTGDSEFGPMLFDTNDQAIYIWEREPTSKPTCYDDCAAAWPPVLTKGTPAAKGGVDPSLLGTTKRDDGSLQVTYNDHPLYFYAHEAPGEVECHNVSTHGGLWWVVQPDGDRAP